MLHRQRAPAGRRSLRRLAPALVLVLAGCGSLGLTKEAPPSSAVLAPERWTTSDPAIVAAAKAPDLSGWWRQWQDAELDRLIEAALRSATDVRTARAKLRQVRASRDLAQAELFPSLSLAYSATRSSSSKATGGTGDSHTVHRLGFDASWEPSLFGGLRDAADGAEADVAASAATLESTKVSLAAEVAMEYLTLRTYQQRLAIARDNVASQAETLQLTEWREQAGLTTRLDVDQATTSLEQSRATIPTLELGRAEAEHRLAVLTGQTPGALRERLQETRPLPRVPDEIAVAIPAETLRQRPDLRAAELTLLAETSRRTERKADLYPTLSLSGSLGWQAFSASGLGSSGSLARSLAASLAANLFDGGRLRAQLAAQEAVQEQALVAYENTLLTALEDVENALAAYASGRERVASQRRAAEAARSAAQLARSLYEVGAEDFQKVLETDRTRLSTEDNLASAEGDLLAAVVKLYKAMGGGWQPAAVSEQKDATQDEAT